MFSNYHPNPSSSSEGASVSTATAIAVQNPGGLDFLESDGSGALKVAIVSGGAGGAQYESGDIDAVPTGNVIMWRKSADDSIVDVSDENPLPVTGGTVSTATLNNVSSSATSVTILSLNANRKHAIIMNDSTQILYVKFGTTASATSFTYKLLAGDTLELPNPVYTGRIDGIWASANGSARTTELT